MAVEHLVYILINFKDGLALTSNGPNETVMYLMLHHVCCIVYIEQVNSSMLYFIKKIRNMLCYYY